MSIPSIIFIHGNSLSAQSFKAQNNDFDAYKQYHFELPGHGKNKSDVYGEEDYCIPGFVRHLRDFIEIHEIKNFIIVGHSLGGHVAIECLGQLPNLKGIVIFGTPPITKPANFAEAFLPSDVMHLAFQEILNDTELNLLANAFTSNTDEISAIISQIKNTEPTFRPLLVKGIGEQKHENERDIVETSTLPIAVFHGENDALISLEYLKSIKWKNLWQNKIHIISNTAHSPQLENPTEFNTLLSQFCETVFG